MKEEEEGLYEGEVKEKERRSEEVKEKEEE